LTVNCSGFVPKMPQS